MLIFHFHKTPQLEIGILYITHIYAFKYVFSIGRKAISSRKKSEVKNLLLAGLITSDVAKKLKISTASVNNLKFNFKKEGIVFPDNRGKKTVSLNPIEVQTKEEA